MSKITSYFSKLEIGLWLFAVAMITGSALLFGGGSLLTIIASVIGVTSIIINAKGNPLGQLLMLFFIVFYGYISWRFSYYGEMMTYMGMTGPMAVFSLISRLRNPFREGKAEVRVNTLKPQEIFFLCFLTAAVTVLFFFILRYFNTANLIPSTLSVTTSFAAVYLTFRRSAYFSLVYAMNDTVLMILWGLASFTDSSYISVVICFLMFLITDIYGFISWKKMKRRQAQQELYPS
ncbi:MAG TPA: nicotinamide riboside transporter PnuC [Ruminococcus sp.]|nr:nicotinamide riboside transporter PnuC [Ruminococcus sp.]